MTRGPDPDREASTRRAFLTGGAVAALGLAGCVAAPEPAPTGDSATPTRTPEEHVVEMTDDLVYAPEALTIAAGDRVVWRNVGSALHTVTAMDGELPDAAAYFASGGFGSEAAAREAFPVGGVEAGGTYSHTFETPGEYPYYCIPHERAGMDGVLTVE